MKTSSVSTGFLLLMTAYFVFVTVSFSFSYSIPYGNIHTNPDSIIASEIKNRKIVMIGEPLHHDFLLYNGLINVLYNWLQICENDKSRDFTLNLVLEMDSITAYYIDNYVKTGHDSLLYSIVAPFLYMEDIEFYENLRKAGMEIESVNEKRSSKIVLNILGFEEAGLENDETILRMNQQESERWFVNDRDKNVSIKLIEFIKSHDNSEDYLVYYGALHLLDGYVNKSLGFSIPIEESYGYFLIYYLKQEFSADSVLSFVQSIYTDKVLSDTIKSVENDPDKFIVVRHFEEPLMYYYPHLFRMVFSSFVIKKLSDRVGVLENCLPGYKATQSYLRYLQGVSFITSERFENSTSLKKWLETDPEFEGLQKIDSKEHCSFIYELSKDTKSRNYGNILRDLGFDNEVYTYSERDTTYWNENWKNINKKAKFINAIGIYWIGYQQEKINAKQYLTDFTGEDHSDPADYLKWYRKKYFGYEKF